MDKESWNFEMEVERFQKASSCTIRSVLSILKENLKKNDERAVVALSVGDPSVFPSFRTSQVAEDAVVEAVRCRRFNGYSPSQGLPQARRAIAEYLSCGHPNSISPDDIFVTIGGRQAIDVIITVLARNGANILLPKPGYPLYEARAAFCRLEVRHFDLLPEKGWEVDIRGVESIADDKTVAMVIINPGNPCGNVYSEEHLKEIAETAKRLGIMVISDEAYAHLAFGNNKFVSMAAFGSIAPVLTIGSISKRWMVPGWRLGWILISDSNHILQKNKIVECIKSYLDISSDAATLTQGAVCQFLMQTPETFFNGILDILRQAVDICCDMLNEIPCITCPCRPQGSMFLMAKLDLSLLKDIKDDLDFCINLSREESLILLPGVTVGLKNYIRITFAVELPALEDGLKRLQAFCARHANSM